jgi:hypothetical protein
MSDELTLDDVKNMPEDHQELESSDYVDYNLIPVGWYLSQQRKITPKKSARTGKLWYEVTFNGGLQDAASGRVHGMGSYPEKGGLFGNRYERDNRPGQTTDIADYLRACGIDPKTVTSTASALEQSQTLPVKAFVAWTNKTEKLPDGTWEKETLKTKDFNKGTAQAPEMVSTVTKDGRTFEARHKVGTKYQKVK